MSGPRFVETGDLREGTKKGRHRRTTESDPVSGVEGTSSNSGDVCEDTTGH